MKFLLIKNPCVLRGQNLEKGKLLELDAVPLNDRGILVGAGLAEVVDRYPVNVPVEGTEDVKKSVKTVKKGKKK